MRTESWSHDVRLSERGGAALMVRTAAAVLLASASLVAFPGAAEGQGRVPPLTLITTAPASASSCAGVTPRPMASRPDTAAARRLASEGSDAALLGDAA